MKDAHTEAPMLSDTVELSGFAKFAELSAEHRAVLARAGRNVAFPAGQLLFAEGAHADRCWLIREGHAHLTAHVPGRGPVIVQTLGPGDLLGWSWLVPPYLWQFSARTTEPVVAIEFDAATLADHADHDLAFARDLYTVLFATILERLQATRARLLDLYGNPGYADGC